jgi:hypothetical protein
MFQHPQGEALRGNNLMPDSPMIVGCQSRTGALKRVEPTLVYDEGTATFKQFKSIMEKNMTTPATSPAVEKVDLSKTTDCVFITTHFSMGIGRMRQIRNLEVTTTADKSQLRHQKQLIDSPELDEIRSQDGYIIRHLNTVSCGYSEATRFLPKTKLEKVWRALEAYRTIRRPSLVAKFMVEYRKLEAVDFEPLKEALGDQFDRGDYKKSEEVERGFSFGFDLRPVGAVDLKGLPDFIVAMELEKEIAIRTAAVEEWRDAMRFAGQKAVDALFNALKPQPDGKRRKLFDSTIENLQEYLDNYNTRDLAGDSEYQQTVVEPLKAIMKGVSMDKIRHSENLKQYIVKQVEGIRQNASLLVQATGRKFR